MGSWISLQTPVWGVRTKTNYLGMVCLSTLKKIKNKKMFKRIDSLLVKTLLIMLPLFATTLLWAYTINKVSGYLYNTFSAPFLK